MASTADSSLPMGSAADAPHGSRPDQVYARLRDLIVQGLLAPGSRIVETDLRHDPGLARIRYVEDRGAELRAVREMADVSVIAGDVHLTRTRQVEMPKPPDVPGKRRFHSARSPA